MFRRLFWKEWRENLWKLYFCGAVSAAYVILLFRIRLFPDLSNCILISFSQMFVVPIVYALDIFSVEMSSRTVYLLFKFPVPRWKIFFAKYLVCILSMVLIFLVTALLMEMMSGAREVDVGYLSLLDLQTTLAGLVLFTWFCGFGAQSRGEAGSLVAIFGVIIGWGIIFFWASVCEVHWALRLTPYFLPRILADAPIPEWLEGAHPDFWLNVMKTAAAQIAGLVLILSTACYRFVKVRRIL